MAFSAVLWFFLPPHQRGEAHAVGAWQRRMRTPQAHTACAVRVCASRSEVRWRRKTRSRGEAGERMTILRAYKTELELNHAHVTACKRNAGAARFAYNWALRRKQEAYQATGTSTSAVDLHRALNARKRTELPWLYA